jgi:alpha-glucosidase
MRLPVPLRIGLGLAAVVCSSASFAADALMVASPDDKLRLAFAVEDGGLVYSVRFHDKPVIDSSPIKITLDGKDLTHGIDLAKGEASRHVETYPWRGVHSQANDRSNGRTFPVTQKTANARYTIEARAFNDAVAFRYIIPGDKQSRVPDESTAFRLPAGSTVWYHDLGGHYEDTYDKKEIDAVAAGEWVAPPLTFKLPGNAGYGSITEAALFNYSGMALQADSKRGFNVVLGHKHPISYPFRLRYSNDIERVSQPASITGTITSPWRVIMVGADLNALVNCDALHNLCPPADPKLFPGGMKADWVKPGRAVWKYLDRGANTFDEMKEFSRMAGELGFEYHVIEGFWSRWSDEQLKELVDYSRQRGVGLILWKHSRQLRTPEAREEFFDKLAKAGAAGAKIDFFDHEHKEIIDLYSTLLADAAKRRLVVNFHGANKPTGESRTWPNELIREAVRGMEASRLQARAAHNATLPFTRFLAGHADYTPVHFGARRGDTTWAHQIATAAVFTEPLLTYGAHPTNLLANPAIEMIKSIPAAWDETIVLPPSEIGEVAVFARRSGQKWFLAVLNGPTARSLKVPLSFLRGGTHQASIVRDDPGEPAAVKLENTTLKPAAPLTIELVAGGGFIARFESAQERRTP